MREIAIDTETTGLSPFNGDKIVEIGCVEMINHVPTNNVFHRYINPQRDVPEEVVKIHGITEEFLKDKPIFSAIADEFLAFIGSDTLVIHNAAFDMSFINAELAAINKEPIDMGRVIDSLAIARRKFPGDKANLDSLCKKFGIDNSHRTKHGALLDAELLSEVYLELVGGREPGLAMTTLQKKSPEVAAAVKTEARPERFFPASEEELKEHRDFLLSKLKDPVWNKLS
ncbi:MAG: DNA polymerase III subunit epsilon [Alphaproteobacteria bacterium]|nr:DNA polymerase III subunit epsilon [Alphaproteobacteria bacterium]